MSMSVSRRAVSDYRRTFAEFAEKVRRTRAVMSASNADGKAIDAALIEMERARMDYNRSRDLLAQQLLNDPVSLSPNPADATADRVREIAELRWELAGKPDGTAEDDWYRAEEIVREATAA